MKYLITDPCYTMSSEAWSDMLKARGYEADNWSKVQTDYGKIRVASSTTNGDGSVKIGTKEITVDSGTVCIIEVSDDFKLEANESGVIVNDEDKASEVYAKALKI